MASMAERAGRFRGRRGRAKAKAGVAARRGRWGVARIVSLITSVIVGLIVLGIVLVLLEASRSNGIVDALVSAGDWLSQPFHGIFSLDTHKAMVAVNWGLAALVYGFVGGFIARLLQR
jgi:hypothetical protein